MKKQIISLLFLLLSAAVFAQVDTARAKARQAKTPEERAAHFANHLEKSLALSAEQKTKVQALALAKEQKLATLREQNKGKEKSAWAAERKQVRDTFISGMKTTLTPEQFAKWEAQKAEHKKKRAEHRHKTPEERAATLADSLASRLSLSPAQKTEVQRLALSREQKMKALREKYKGQDEKAAADDRRQVQEEFRNGMKAALTAEQFEKWKAMKKAQKAGDKTPGAPEKKK